MYDQFAADYHWLHDDIELRLGTMTPGVRAVLAGLPPGARVLDAACGIGLDAVALATRGFDVMAADGSTAMVAASTRRLAAAGVTLPVIRCPWADLPDRVEPASFDAVLCVGNSIGHARDEDEMVAAFRAFGIVLRPGGIVVLDTHHWEMLAEQGDVLITDLPVIERDGLRAHRRYRWRWSYDPWTCRIEFQLELRRGETLDHRSHEVTLFPFTTTELATRLRSAGLVGVGFDARPDDDRYTAVGRTPVDG